MLNKIPKVIHLYWDGSAMPFLCFLTVFTFRKLNPEWIIKIYSPLVRSDVKPWDTDENKIKYCGKDYFEFLHTIPNCEFLKFDFEKIGVSNNIGEVQKSDFLRWYVLSTEGGVWSDFDIIYFRGIDEIDLTNQEVSKGHTDIDFSVCYDHKSECCFKYSIGLLFAKKDCRFYGKILQAAINTFKENDYQGAGSQIFNKNFPELDQIYQSEIESNVWNMSMDIVYSYNHSNIRYLYETVYLGCFTQNSIGVHFYYGSVVTRYYMEILEKNQYNMRNTLLVSIDKFNENTNYKSL